MFINLIRKSFLDVVKNPIITLLLVIYFIIISMLMGCLGYQKNIIIALVLALTSFLFVAIFIAGWLRIIKEISLKKPDEERTRSYIGMFLEGVGENVVPYTFGLIIYIIFSILFAYVAYIVSLKLFGNPKDLIMEIQAFSTPNESIEYIKNLPQDKLLQLYAFPISLMLSATGCLFIFMYYFPAIIFETKANLFLKPFIALKNNLRFLFSKHFFMSLALFLLLCFINITVVIIKTYCPVNPVVDVLYIFYIIYFLSFAVMLICNYYGKYNPCDNGPDCIGENKSDDNVSEEN